MIVVANTSMNTDANTSANVVAVKGAQIKRGYRPFFCAFASCFS